jgi:peroxiredoxin
VIKPGTPAPVLDLPLVGGGRWRLGDQEPEAFTLVVFYRGRHCPVCRSYLQQLDRMLDDFAGVGVTSVVAVSTDGLERAENTVESWQLERLQVAYGQSIESAREWGLFVSKGCTAAEPEHFAEPGLFLIRPDTSLYAGVINTMPFARPRLDDVLGAVRYVRAHDYPARGES